MMYEQFKNKFAMKISDMVSYDILKEILIQLDQVAYNYDVCAKETQLVVYNSELPQMVKTFLVCKKLEGLSDGTLYNYRLHLHRFFLEIQKSPENITPNDIRVFLYCYQEQRKISNRSLDKYREIICNFFEWAYNEDYLEKNIVKSLKPIKYEVKPRKALSQIELEYIRRGCRTLKEKAIIEFLYSTGCRVSELADLKKCDVNFDSKAVHLFGKGNKHRVSFMNAKCVVTLKEYLASRDDDNEYLFVSDRKPHNRIHKAGVEKIVRNISNRAIINTGKHVTPHILRHTTATSALDHGMNVVEVSRLLGHNRVETTMEYITTDSNSVKNNHRNCVI